MTSSPSRAPVPIQRGRRDERTLLARLRVQRLWDLRHRDPPALDLGLLVVRVAIGVTFLAHGVDKLLDLDATRGFFASLDIPAPAVMAPFVALTETIGGLLLIAGLATPLAGVALAGDMLVAYLTAHVAYGFFVSDGGGELVLLLGAASLALVGTGPGRYRVTPRARAAARSPRCPAASPRSAAATSRAPAAPSRR